MLDDYFRQYGLLATFMALAVAVPTGMLAMSWLLSFTKIHPRNPYPLKESIYECGFETLSGKWSQFNFRYYSIALLFVVFDVEILLLYPWAVAMPHLGFAGFFAGALFLAILVVGFVYDWAKKALEWA